MMQSVLILAFSEINRDPRVIRQIQYFRSRNYKIFLTGLDYKGDEKFFPLIKNKSPHRRMWKLAIMLLKLNDARILDFIYHSSFEELNSEGPYDIIFANDAETWPLASLLKDQMPKSKLIFDAHEYYPEQLNDRKVWTYLHGGFAAYICKRYIPKADAFITVCDGLAKGYRQLYGVESRIMLNTPIFEEDLRPSPIGKTIDLVHHGIANRSRKIEKMIELMDYLDERFTLSLILIPVEKNYFNQLIEQAKGKRIKFIEPVPTEKIASYINQFDIGIFILEEVNYNYKFALPNKFFEFIQARLAIAIGPSIEMKKIVEDKKLGIVCDTFVARDMAAQLNTLTNEDIMTFKENASSAAKVYNSAYNEVILDDLLDKLKPALENG